MRYLFGDSDVAAHRLEVLNEVFAPTSGPLLAEVASQRIGLLVDLGCGPGPCTRFLAEVTGCERAVGLDRSGRFIALARTQATAGIEFHEHDVTVVPFPVGPADLIYARFLLTHLSEPAALLERWATQVRPGGHFVLEEGERIDTTQPTFRAYLELVTAFLANQGTEHYIGATLARLPAPAGTRRELSRVARFPVTNQRAATMFFLNMQSWKTDPFVVGRMGNAALGEMEVELHRLMSTEDGQSDIEWGLRQLVYRRD
ncbi:MAG: trans-aconitate 2-methyltransferase [Chloroflexota bacterium]|jgi:SAM-dependent methyltransferase|nr:trans-aconitate 2-methyltransferase [Chloroflexota bacterium]